MTSFQEREKLLAAVEEENMELTCRLRTISQAVSDKEEFYEYLLTKYKVQWEELTEKNVVKGVEREMERWEKKQLEELRVKQVNKVVQTVQPVLVEVSPVGVQTYKVEPLAPVVVEGSKRASYASAATQASVRVVAPAPVGLSPVPAAARALVVHGVSCRQSMVDILYKVRRLRLGTGERVLGVRWLLGEQRWKGKWVSSVVVCFSGVVPMGGRCIQFGGQWCPVDKYKFERPARWLEARGHESSGVTG